VWSGHKSAGPRREDQLKSDTGADNAAKNCDAASLGFPSTLPFDNAEIAFPAVCELRGEQTILLVEDEAFVRDATAEVLERAGYRVAVAANVSHAMQARRKLENVDLLLADVVLPGASGCELAAELLRLSPQIGILLISGYAEHFVLGEQLLHSAEYLAKPFSVAMLLDRLRKVLNKRRIHTKPA
jgi:CheY-like chemotaxis protein